MNIMRGKSQLDVWGAAIITNLGISGSVPCVCHPEILSKHMDIHRRTVLNTGVSKIV